VPRELSKWSALLRPYQINVWAPLVVTLCLAGPIGWMISNYTKTKGKHLTVTKSYETTFKIVIQRGRIEATFRCP